MNTGPLNVVVRDVHSIHAADLPKGFGTITTEFGNLPVDLLEARLTVVGLIVHTELTLRFLNPFDRCKNPLFVLPLPPRATVASVRYGPDLQPDDAEEQVDRPVVPVTRHGVFELPISPIGTGEACDVRVILTGPLSYVDDAATLEFQLLPDNRHAPSALPDGRAPAMSVFIDVDPADLPVTEISTNLQPIDVASRDGLTRLWYKPGKRTDRDLVVRLELQRSTEVSGSLVAVPNASGAGGTFALTLLPPASAPRVQRDLVVLIDCSLSMEGWKLTAARRAAVQLIEALTATDRLAVMSFAHDVESAFVDDRLTPATDEARHRACEYLTHLGLRHSTNLLRPLEAATTLLSPASRHGVRTTHPGKHPQVPTATTDRNRTIVFVTDGEDTKNHDQAIVATFARTRVGTFARTGAAIGLHVIGIGDDINTTLLTALASRPGDRFDQVHSPDDLESSMTAVRRRVARPVLSDPALAGKGFAIEGGSVVPSPIPDLHEGNAVVAIGRFVGTASGGVVVDASTSDGGYFEVYVPAMVRPAGADHGAYSMSLRPRLEQVETDRMVLATASVRHRRRT